MKKEIALTFVLLIFSILSIVMQSFNQQIAMYIIISLNLIDLLYLIISFKIDYKMDIVGIIIIAFGSIIIISQILFLLSYNSIMWATTVLKIILNVLYIIGQFIAGAGVSVINADNMLFNICIGCMCLIFAIVYLSNLKKYNENAKE